MRTALQSHTERHHQRCRLPLKLLAHHILELTAEVEDLKQRIADAVAAHTPALLEIPGVGTDSAALQVHVTGLLNARAEL